MSFWSSLAKFGNSAGTLSVALGIAGYTLQTCTFVVPAGHRAIVWDRFDGLKPDNYKEGLNFKLPWVQRPFFYEVRTRSATINTETGTKDLQTVSVKLRILYKPNPDELTFLHSKYGPNYDEKILPGIGNEVLKAVVAEWNASDLVTQRETVSAKIRNDLINRARQFEIFLDDVSLVHLAFSPEYSKAIELKVIAQQEAERYQHLVAIAQQEKEANIIKAEGETIAAKLVMESLVGGQGYLELQKVETAKKVVDMLASNPNIKYVPQGSNFLLNLNQNKDNL